MFLFRILKVNVFVLEKVLMTLMNEAVERISDQHLIFHLDTKYKEKLENKQFDSI